MATTVLKSTLEDGIARVTLARPDVRNAFNAELIAALREEFVRRSAQPGVRAIVLAGDGPAFCGGADVNWMREALDLSYDENLADAGEMSDMFRVIDRCEKPVVGRIHGAALGGGCGLAAVCDVVVTSDETIFGFTEVRLGIVPAVISPFVLAKIGPSHARALFLTGQRFDAARAKEIGLVHVVTSAPQLDTAVDAVLAQICASGPCAVSAAKHLIADVRAASYDSSRDVTAAAIARRRTSDEGQEGLRAFIEHRPARFTS